MRSLVLLAVLHSNLVGRRFLSWRSLAAIYARARRRREPLDLDADIFRYRVGRDSIQPVRDVAVQWCDGSSHFTRSSHPRR